MTGSTCNEAQRTRFQHERRKVATFMSHILCVSLVKPPSSRSVSWSIYKSKYILQLIDRYQSIGISTLLWCASLLKTTLLKRTLPHKAETSMGLQWFSIFRQWMQQNRAGLTTSLHSKQKRSIEVHMVRNVSVRSLKDSERHTPYNK